MSDFVISNNALLKYTGNEKDVVIPDGVIDVVDMAFKDNYTIEAVFIPASVHSVGRGAFTGCKNLKVVRYVKDGNWTVIGESAFEDCESLNYIHHAMPSKNILENHLPNKLTTIGAKAFKGCKSLQSIVVHQKVTDIEHSIFSHCLSLKSVVWMGKPDDGDLPSWTFFMCTSLENVYLPDSLIFIGDNCFNCCSALSYISMPRNLSVVCKKAFKSCVSLTSLTLPKETYIIEEGAFENCIDLHNITFLTDAWNMRIEDNAFNSCSSLTTVKFSSDKLKDRLNDANKIFVNCDSLNKFEFPSGSFEKSFGKWVFNKKD